MSNYQRLISYIYTYEGGIKGKNIGFAKLETRNVQCKITVNVKKIFVGGNPMGVYLLSNQGEIRIGTLFARNGAGEFRATVNPANIEDSGRGMDEFYGLSVHDVESSWRSYTTIWEDAVAHAAEVELADVTSEKVLMKQNEKVQTQDSVLDEELPISKEIEEELDREELISAALTETVARSRWQTEGYSVRESLLESQTAVAALDTRPVVLEELQESYCTEGEPGPMIPEISIPEIPQPQPQPEIPEFIEKPAWSMPEPELEPHVPGTEIAQPDKNHQEMWEYLRKHHAKIMAFDYEDGCEILILKPQDIGLLPRDNWIFGNNSFLLHGYYSYRYLILARLENPWGMPRYLLGVPGNYLSNEKYMAAMFGFPDFVLSKKQPSRESKFGYWYTEIKLGD